MPMFLKRDVALDITPEKQLTCINWKVPKVKFSESVDVFHYVDNHTNHSINDIHDSCNSVEFSSLSDSQFSEYSESPETLNEDDEIICFDLSDNFSLDSGFHSGDVCTHNNFNKTLTKNRCYNYVDSHQEPKIAFNDVVGPSYFSEDECAQDYLQEYDKNFSQRGTADLQSSMRDDVKDLKISKICEKFETSYTPFKPTHTNSSEYVQNLYQKGVTKKYKSFEKIKDNSAKLNHNQASNFIVPKVDRSCNSSKVALDEPVLNSTRRLLAKLERCRQEVYPGVVINDQETLRKICQKASQKLNVRGPQFKNLVSLQVDRQQLLHSITNQRSSRPIKQPLCHTTASA